MAENDAEKLEKLRQEIEAAISDVDMLSLYVNGFSVTVGSGDVMFVLKRNGQSVAVLNMSYTLAKTLATKVGGVIANLESKAKTVMLTTDDVDTSLREG